MDDLAQAIWELLQQWYVRYSEMWADHPSAMIAMMFVIAMAIIWTEARSDDQ